jgi:hypothetical protein
MEQVGDASLTQIDYPMQHLGKRNMLRGDVGRTILAVIVGYTASAVLVAATEQLLPRLIASTKYFVADLITQCLYATAGGYLCCLIAKRCKRWIALVALMSLGFLVGTISLITSWKTEPHWYEIAGSPPRTITHIPADALLSPILTIQFYSRGKGVTAGLQPGSEIVGGPFVAVRRDLRHSRKRLKELDRVCDLHFSSDNGCSSDAVAAVR